MGVAQHSQAGDQSTSHHLASVSPPQVLAFRNTTVLILRYLFSHFPRNLSITMKWALLGTPAAELQGNQLVDSEEHGSRSIPLWDFLEA